jgi:predicted DNA-binding transcriptional regulator AlpA
MLSFIISQYVTKSLPEVIKASHPAPLLLARGTPYFIRGTNMCPARVGDRREAIGGKRSAGSDMGLISKAEAAKRLGMHQESLMRAARKNPAWPQPIKMGPSDKAHVKFDDAKVSDFIEWRKLASKPGWIRDAERAGEDLDWLR